MEIITVCRVIGFHCWESAPPHFKYLSDRHRHEFDIWVLKRVDHNDRDVEINQLRYVIEEWLHKEYGDPCEFGGMSCEDIAETTAKRFNLSRCVVLEDGLAGAIYTEE